MKCNLFPFFFCYSLWGGGEGGDFGSGSGSKFNCGRSGRVGSDDLGYGPGSGFSFEPVQTSKQFTVAHRKKTGLFPRPCKQPSAALSVTRRKFRHMTCGALAAF